MQAAVDISAAENHDSADAETASDAGVTADDVKKLQKKLAQVTKTMRDTNARNESIIHDLQNKPLKAQNKQYLRQRNTRPSLNKFTQ